MCIDLIRFGGRLDVPFLLEQIWFTIDGTELKIVEVYDVLLKNPKGCDVLSEVWALFPHSCFDGSRFQIDAVPMGPMDYKSTKYDWPFNGPPRWKNRNVGDPVVREIAVECQDIFNIETEEGEGKALSVEQEQIDIPDIFSVINVPAGATVEAREALMDQCKTTLASGVFTKTLVKICFPSTPLTQSETGWMRLVVRPIKIEASHIKSRKIPGIAEIVEDPKEQEKYVFSNEQRLDVVCPWVLRRKLYRKAKKGTDCISRALAHLSEVLSSNGTSTRIADHRIALVAPKEGMDIYDAIPTTKGVLFYGTQEILDETHVVSLWVCGSNRNRDGDLIHSAMRVINRLALYPETKGSNLKNELAPSGKYESFSLLVNLMKDANLIVNVGSEEEPTYKLTTKKLYSAQDMPKEDDFDFNRLREIYAKSEVKPQDMRLVRQFTDLHPFRILFRVVWLNLGEKTRKLLSVIIRLAESEKVEILLR